MQTRIPPPVVGAVTAAAMWWTATRFDLLAFEFPGRVWAAAVIALIGLTLDVVSIIGFLRARTTVNPLAPERADTLVVSGFYRISRNPMYLGMLLLLTAAAVYLGEGANAVFLAVFVALINVLQIAPEERALAARFGQDYLDYCQRVRRWI